MQLTTSVKQTVTALWGTASSNLKKSSNKKYFLCHGHITAVPDFLCSCEGFSPSPSWLPAPCLHQPLPLPVSPLILSPPHFLSLFFFSVSSPLFLLTEASFATPDRCDTSTSPSCRFSLHFSPSLSTVFVICLVGLSLCFSAGIFNK